MECHHLGGVDGHHALQPVASWLFDEPELDLRGTGACWFEWSRGAIRVFWAEFVLPEREDEFSDQRCPGVYGHVAFVSWPSAACGLVARLKAVPNCQRRLVLYLVLLDGASQPEERNACTDCGAADRGRRKSHFGPRQLERQRGMHEATEGTPKVCSRGRASAGRGRLA